MHNKRIYRYQTLYFESVINISMNVILFSEILFLNRKSSSRVSFFILKGNQISFSDFIKLNFIIMPQLLNIILLSVAIIVLTMTMLRIYFNSHIIKLRDTFKQLLFYKNSIIIN